MCFIADRPAKALGAQHGTSRWFNAKFNLIGSDLI